MKILLFTLIGVIIWNSQRIQSPKNLCSHSYIRNNNPVKVLFLITPKGVTIWNKQLMLNSLLFDEYQLQCASESVTSIWKSRTQTTQNSHSQAYTPSPNIITISKAPQYVLTYSKGGEKNADS